MATQDFFKWVAQTQPVNYYTEYAGGPNIYKYGTPEFWEGQYRIKKGIFSQGSWNNLERQYEKITTEQFLKNTQGLTAGDIITAARLSAEKKGIETAPGLTQEAILLGSQGTISKETTKIDKNVLPLLIGGAFLLMRR